MLQGPPPVGRVIELLACNDAPQDEEAILFRDRASFCKARLAEIQRLLVDLQAEQETLESELNRLTPILHPLRGIPARY